MTPKLRDTPVLTAVVAAVLAVTVGIALTIDWSSPPEIVFGLGLVVVLTASIPRWLDVIDEVIAWRRDDAGH